MEATSNPFSLRAWLILLASAVFIGAQPVNAAVTLDFANLPGTAINFDGSGNFSFSGNPTYQFSITGAPGGVGDSVGLDGYVTPGGPFKIGTIMTTGPEQTAPVTGNGVLHITDASSLDLTGNVVWVNITTIGTEGVIDLNGTVNLTNITYSGANQDLQALAAQGPATDSITFQFVPAMSLTLLDTTAESTSYSGSISANTPEPGSIGLLGMGLVRLLASRRRSR